MKPLVKMTATERGKLLHELFQLEMPAVLTTLEGATKYISQCAETISHDWNHPDLRTEALKRLASETFILLQTQREQLTNDSDFFAAQLFNADRLLFISYCLKAYASIRRNELRYFLYTLFGPPED